MKKIFTITFICIALSGCNKDSNPVNTVYNNEQKGAIVGWASISSQNSEKFTKAKDVKVTILGTNKMVMSDTTGYWSFTNLDSGKYTLQFTKTGYDTAIVADILINGADTVRLTGGAGGLMEKLDVEPIRDFKIEYTYKFYGLDGLDTITSVHARGRIVNHTPSLEYVKYTITLFASASPDVTNTEYEAIHGWPLMKYEANGGFFLELIHSLFKDKYASGTTVYIRAYPIFEEAYLVRENGVVKARGVDNTIVGQPSEVVSFIMP
jgi:hypothetical protein